MTPLRNKPNHDGPVIVTKHDEGQTEIMMATIFHLMDGCNFEQLMRIRNSVSCRIIRKGIHEIPMTHIIK